MELPPWDTGDPGRQALHSDLGLTLVNVLSGACLGTLGRAEKVSHLLGLSSLFPSPSSFDHKEVRGLIWNFRQQSKWSTGPEIRQILDTHILSAM